MKTALRPITRLILFLAVCAGIFLVLTAISGCSSAGISRSFDYDHTYKVTVWSGGAAAKTYTTRDSVRSEDNSDGFYFTDAATGKLVIVSGTLTCEQAN